MGKDPKKKQAQRRITKTLDKEVHKASKVVESALGRRKKATRAAPLASRTGVPRSLLLEWANAIARPFENRGAICPVNFNPTPSLMMTTATTTFNNMSSAVAANSTNQWIFYPGHGPIVPSTAPGTDFSISTSMDGTAYHAVGMVGVNGGTHAHVGPINLVTQGGTSITAGCGFLTPGLAVGGCSNSTTGSYVAQWDEGLPYVYGGGGQLQEGAHMRWQCVSAAVRIVNQTPEISRGGNVTSVQFVNTAGVVRSTGEDATLQGHLEHNPSFKLLGICDDVTEVVWIPRVNDLAYWHSIVPPSNVSTSKNALTQKHSGAGFAIFFNNPTDSVQTYAIQVIYNWMLAGNYLAAVSSPAAAEPILRSPVEQTIVHLQNSSSTAAHAPIVAAAATTSANESEGMMSKLARAGFDGLSDIAHTVGKAFAQEASQQITKIAGAAGQRAHKVLYPGMPRA